jgi:sugar phosphate isomerase/epimerase
MRYSRRELGKLMLAVPAAGLLPRDLLLAQAKPNSKWAGVQVGLNVPYNFNSGALARTLPADETLQKTVQLGISAVEMRSQPIELAMGAPAAAVAGGRGDAARAAAEQLREWRQKTDPKTAGNVRKQYESAGVKIEIVKFDGIYNFTDPEMDYAFNLARAAGARAISCELEMEGVKRLGQFADTHKMPVGLHGHTKTTAAMYDEAFSFAKYNWANIDIGHWVAGGLGDPVEIIRKYHDRITHIHVKDRKKPTDGKDGANVPFGQGDTPVVEVLRLIRDNKYPIQATIEFEYLPGSASAADRMAELPKAIEYCRNALLK